MSSARLYKQCVGLLIIAIVPLVLFFISTLVMAGATNIISYSDTLSDSAPDAYSNHTLAFTLNVALSPGAVIELTPPGGFSITSATTTFTERNVELLVNGIPRVSDAGPTMPGTDAVEIDRGSPGLIRYTLAPDLGVAKGSRLEFRVGNHTTESFGITYEYSTTTGTTTLPADIEPIQNSADLGRHDVRLEIYDGGYVAGADFIIFLNQKVEVPNSDTTEEDPPERFNGAPTSTVSGTTLSVEISFQTNEFAVCKFASVPDVPFNLMPFTFTNTGKVFHSHVVPIVPNSFNQFFARCIDDEGNVNLDDFVIEFAVNQMPTGSANTEGAISGDGTGTGNAGTGDGSGSGGTTGQSSGEEPFLGGSQGTGGAGGGGGGGRGDSSGSTAGGGFESEDAPYRSGDARVIISGYAYPNSRVGILVDGNFFDTTSANSAGVYSVVLDQIARGVYTFGVYGEGPDGVRSSTFSTSFTVTGARTSALSNINVAPSIAVSPNPVNPGQTLNVSGYALPNAIVTIENGPTKGSASTLSVTSDARGRWATTVNTDRFSVGTYQIRARSEQEAEKGGVKTNFSNYTFYGVGKAADVPQQADLNRDGKVNLIDFSILLFWWNTDGGDSEPPADINRDNKVNLTDFSILLFNWTG